MGCRLYLEKHSLEFGPIIGSIERQELSHDRRHECDENFQHSREVAQIHSRIEMNSAARTLRTVRTELQIHFTKKSIQNSHI